MSKMGDVLRFIQKCGRDELKTIKAETELYLASKTVTVLPPRLIRLSIKGDKIQAQAAIEAHGIGGAIHIAEGHLGSSFWDVPETARALVVNWFCESEILESSSGFQVGTLLHHN